MNARLFFGCLMVVLTSLITGCATSRPPTLKAQASAEQMAAYRGGKTYVSSLQPHTFLTASVVQENLVNDRPPTLVISVRNTGGAPLDLKLSDFAFLDGTIPVLLMTRGEVIDALNSDQMWRTVMLALAGGIETGRANVAATNRSFSGTSSAEYKGLDGRTVGTSQGTFQGSISNPAAGRAAMNDISDRTDANIARVRSASEGAKATAEDLILDRETVFPNGSVTFMLVPKIEKASLKVLAQYLLVANIGGDVHKIVFQKNVGD